MSLTFKLKIVFSNLLHGICCCINTEASITIHLSARSTALLKAVLQCAPFILWAPAPPKVCARPRTAAPSAKILLSWFPFLAFLTRISRLIVNRVEGTRNRHCCFPANTITYLLHVSRVVCCHIHTHTLFNYYIDFYNVITYS